MNRVLLIARREYIEHVKTKSFIVGIILLPLIFAGSIVIQEFLERAETGNPVVVLDTGANLGPGLVEAYGESEIYPLSVETAPVGDTEQFVEALSARVLDGELSAFLGAGADVVEGGEVLFYSENVSKEEPRESLMSAVNQAVRMARFGETGIEPEVVQAIYAPVPERDFTLGGEDGAVEVDSMARKAKEWIPMVFVYLMFIGIMGQSQTMLTSTVEEKSNRVMEVLLSSVSPLQLMAGKMIGLGGVSFTLFSVWMAGGAFMIIRNGWESMVDLATLGYFLMFFVPGFLLYAAIMAALGSLCNDLKEAQNMMTPVMMIMLVPLMLMFWVGQNPAHPISVALSFVPVFTPFLMINRLASAQPPGALEITAGFLVLVATIGITVWLSARVFRVGILLYGKPPRFREVLRWLREA